MIKAIWGSDDEGSVTHTSQPGEPGEVAQINSISEAGSASEKSVANSEDLVIEDGEETKQDNSIRILIFSIFIIGFAIGGIFGGLALNNYSSKRRNGNENTPENGEEFAVISTQLRDTYAILADTDSANRWSGGAAASHTDQNQSLRATISRMADLNDEAHATTQTQAEQVSRGRTDLGNNVTELGFAIPIAQSLYFSGAAGPALSYNFQLAISSSAVDSSVNTASETHKNARQNTVRLNALNQEYDQMFAALPADASPSQHPVSMPDN